MCHVGVAACRGRGGAGLGAALARARMHPPGTLANALSFVYTRLCCYVKNTGSQGSASGFGQRRRSGRAAIEWPAAKVRQGPARALSRRRASLHVTFKCEMVAGGEISRTYSCRFRYIYTRTHPSHVTRQIHDPSVHGRHALERAARQDTRAPWTLVHCHAHGLACPSRPSLRT